MDEKKKIKKQFKKINVVGNDFESDLLPAATGQQMWNLVSRVFPQLGRYVQLPIMCVIGFLGYHAEGWISDRYTPATAPVVQQRQERFLENMDSPSPKKLQHKPLEVNLPPSLSA